SREIQNSIETNLRSGDKEFETMETMTQLDLKLERLRDKIRDYGSCVVAYSGGVDSVFLAHVAHQVLGGRTLAVIADTPSLPRRELDEALAIAKQFHFPV